MEQKPDRRQQQHELATDLAQTIINECLARSEEGTRKLVDEAIAERLENAKTGLERGAIIEAKTILDELTYEQMVELLSIYEDQHYKTTKVYGVEASIRQKVFLSNEEDEFYVQEEDGINHYFIRFRFIYESGHYLYLIKLNHKEGEGPQTYFYRYEFCTDDDDKFIRITDEKLIEELRKEVLFAIQNSSISEDGWL